MKGLGSTLIMITLLAAGVGFAVTGQVGVAIGCLVMIPIVNHLSRRSQSIDETEEFSPESLLLLKPFRQFAGDLQELGKANSASGFQAEMVQQAGLQAKELELSVAPLLRQRDQMATLRKQGSIVQVEKRRLMERLEHATDQEERASLESALQEQTSQEESWRELDAQVRRLEAKVKEAHTQLNGIRNRLLHSTASLSGAEIDYENLAGAISELKALEQGFDEMESYLKN